MRVTVTARHCDITDALRERARALLARLARVSGRPHDGSVVFREEHGVSAAEIRLHTTRGHVFVATAEGPVLRVALDRAAARIRHQLDKAPRRRARRAVAREVS